MLRIILLVFFFATSAKASDKMSFSFLDGRIKLGGDFYVRFETRSDYYTRDGRRIKDHGMSSRQRLSLQIAPKENISFLITLLKTIDSDEPHPYLFPYAYDHGTDIHQAYLFIRNLFQSPVSLWFGRREIEYLHQRLIGHSYGWTNKPIIFDGAGLIVDTKKVKVDLFYLNQVLRDLDESPAFNDDWFGKPADLYGIWLTLKRLYIGNIDLYVLYDDRDSSKKGKEDDSYTPGIRIYGKKGSFDYDVNLSLQFGRKHIGGEKLERHAWAFYADFGYTFYEPFKTRIALQYNFASGDGDPNDHSYHTFDQLYACVHGKYGLMDLFCWQNVHDIYAYANLFPEKGTKILFGIHSFFLDDTHDAWYNCYKKIQRWDKTGSASSFVGNELDLLVVYNVRSRNKLLNNFVIKAFYGHFFAGPYVDDTGQDDDADYLYFQVEYRF